MTVFNTVLPSITLIIGYAATMITESRRDRRAERRSAVERAEAQAVISSGRRDAFELWVLDRAYVQLGDLSRVCGAIHFFDMREAKTTGKYMPTLLAPGQSDTLFVTTQAAKRTAIQIPDDGIRSLVEQAIKLLIAPSMSFQADPFDATLAMQEAAGAADAASEAIGARMRQLYKTGTTVPEVSPQYHEPQIGPSGLLKAPNNGAEA